MFNVSFGSNYRLDAGKNFPDDIIDKLYKYERKGAEITTEFVPFKEAMQTGIYERINVSAPDKYDGEIETLLLSKGIDFHKQTKKEALDLENIKSRIQLSRLSEMQGCHLVEIDTQKLDELFKKDGMSYIEPNGKNGIGNRYQNVGEYLKTGQNIDATQVVLNEYDGDLTASILDGRHRFAYLRDLGMEKIPVAIDKDSFKTAQKYGLI